MPQDCIQSSSAVLLDATAAPVALRRALVDLVLHCAERSGRAPVRTAITGQPIVDSWRDAAFSRGLHEALAEISVVGPIELLYVGCGSCPVPLLTLLAKFSAEQLQITLVDRHPKHLRRALSLFRALGAETYIAESVVADAAQWTPRQRYHVAVCAVLDSALQGGASVAITANLAACVDGPWLPERVEVCAVLIDHDDGREVPLGTVLRLSRAGLCAYDVQVPGLEAWGDEVVLTTSVSVYGEQRIGPGQSGITQNRRIPPGPCVLPGVRLSFGYNTDLALPTYTLATS